jgi:ribosomal protein L44E
MSEVETFFRYCPQCGKRFHIKLVGKKKVGSERESVDVDRDYAVGSSTRPWPQGFAVVEEREPVTFDIEDFQYSYRCKHCGHEWAENRLVQKKED